MSIDEAIEDSRENDYNQVAEWLEELKVRRTIHTQAEKEIRIDERAKVLDEVKENIIPLLCENDVEETVVDECICFLEQIKE